MTKPASSPALDPNWKEMTLPHYLKELRLAIQDGWEKDPLTPKADIKFYEDTRKAQEKKGAGANVSDAKKFLQDSVGVISGCCVVNQSAKKPRCWAMPVKSP